MVKPEILREILDIDYSFNKKQIIRLFGIPKGKDEPLVRLTDTFTLLKNTYYNNANIETTVGRYIRNKFAIPVEYLKEYGYDNTPFDTDHLKSFESKCATLLLADKMSVKNYTDYLDRAEWITMSFARTDIPGLNMDILKPLPEVNEKKKELYSKYGDQLNKDQNVMSTVENELLKTAKDAMENKYKYSGYDFFKSGEFSFKNNYKKASINNGIMKNPVDGNLIYIKSNFIDGVSIPEYDKISLLTIFGGYSRGVETQDYGYITKKINNACMSLVLDDDPNSDCGTEKCLTITIKPSLSSLYIGRFIKEGGKLIELTHQNIGSYIGKTVQMRSIMYCNNDHICSKCAGSLFSKLGIKNIGTVVSNMSGSLLNLSLKSFHSSAVSFDKINIEDYIEEL